MWLRIIRASLRRWGYSRIHIAKAPKLYSKSGITRTIQLDEPSSDPRTPMAAATVSSANVRGSSLTARGSRLAI